MIKENKILNNKGTVLFKDEYAVFFILNFDKIRGDTNDNS